MPRLITLNLVVEDPIPLEDNDTVLKTRLTHPKLEGELYFVHTKRGDRNDILKAVDESPISAVIGLCSTVKEIINGNDTKLLSEVGAPPNGSSVGPASQKGPGD